MFASSGEHSYAAPSAALAIAAHEAKRPDDFVQAVINDAYPHQMFERVNASLGADWTLHDLHHSAASRMSRDGELSLTDVQRVLGHAHLTTTEVYLNSQELQQPDEKPQVSRSQDRRNGVPHVLMPAV